MSYTPRDGSGGLWKNQHKSEDRHPDAKGYIIAHRDIKQGERVDLAAWTRTDRNGNRWQSLQLDDPRRQEEAQEPIKDAPAGDPSDEIPF